MGLSCFSSLNSCCNRSETSGNLYEGSPIDNNKINGYNTSQKILELKAYRFFINNLYDLMMINNSIEQKEFYFIKKSWIRSWYKYTCYEKIRPLLIKNEINNEIDFHKTILDHKKELNFEGFIEKEKPEPIKFFAINNMNTNVKENFYIFDSKILKKFIEIYDVSDDVEDKEAFSVKGEIGKGRIIFDVKEYILIMILDKNWEIKQMMIIFGTEAEHKHFLKNIYGRALSFISKELKKIVQKKKMINYQKDEIYVYDDRDFIKYEYLNNNKKFKQYIQNENAEIIIKKEEKISKNEMINEKQTNKNDSILNQFNEKDEKI